LPKTIALIENPTHGINVFPEWKAKSSRVFKKDKSGKVPSPESVATQTGGAFFTDKAMRGAKVFSDVISDINLLIGKLRFAFPSVSVSTTKEEFNNIINSPDVRTQVSDGKIILGLTKDGKIYLNPEMSSLQTPIHEFGHIWIDFLRSKDSGKKGTDLLSKGLDLIKNTKEHKKAIEKYGNTEIALEEALVELMANKGATIIDAAKRSKFKSWMNAAFKYIQDKFTTFKDLDASKISKIKLDDFINIGLADLFSGKEVSAKFAPELSESAFKARMSAITNINEIVRVGLDNGISKEAIIKVLRDKKFSEKEISNAINKPVKLNESNVENAIELLDDINENKRKSERASSKRKADLDQKIAEAETELDKISEEAQIVKAINDNFDKIKKELKEQGLLTVKC
jgi:DNA-binding transcriptional MerR regulator